MNREEYKGLIIRLEQDSDCESPLDCDPGVTITYRKGARNVLGNTPETPEEHQETARRIDAGELIGLPVYAYVHSGVALNTTGFNCPWDSGQSGFIHITRKTTLEWQGGKVLTAKRRAAVLDSLRAVVETYSQWLNGECYGYIISTAPTDDNPDCEELDSCYGFIGYDYAMQEAKSQADWHAEDIIKTKHTTWRAALREARERFTLACRGMVTV